jgi:hypothetical protein
LLPLVRLRVEHTGFDRLRPAEFARFFVGRVANPSEILLFHRKASLHKKAGQEDGEAGELSATTLFGIAEAPDADCLVATTEERLSRLTAESIAADRETAMIAFAVDDVIEAVGRFVDKVCVCVFN